MQLFAAPDIERTDRPDGSILLVSREPLAPYVRSLGDLLRAGAAAHPDRLLVTRATTGETVTWSRARQAADSLAQAMLDAGLGPDRPLLVLSGNSVAHAHDRRDALPGSGVRRGREAVRRRAARS